MMSRVIIFFSFVLFTHSSFGQKINWKKYDRLPFKEDTTFGFVSRNYYNAQYRVPPYDITESNSVFEIRVIQAMHQREDLPIRLFQFYKDSTVLIEYYQDPDPEVENFIKKYRDSSSEAYTKGITPLIEKNGGVNWKINRTLLAETKAYKVIEELTKMNLFTFNANEEITKAEKRISTDPQYSAIIKNYQIIKGPMSYNRSIILEIKYKNKYRVLRTGGVLFYYIDGQNRMQHIEQTGIGSDLFEYLMPYVKR